MLEVGDTIEIILESQALVHSKIIGVVVGVFDALTEEGKPDINLEIDVRYGQNCWFRYKPLIDGGTYRVLKKGK